MRNDLNDVVKIQQWTWMPN